MEFELKGALKKYRRMRSWRRWGMMIFATGVLLATNLVDLSRTDMLICYVGVFGLWTASELEMRLKTIQIRLAGISDQLNALSGRDPERGLRARRSKARNAIFS